MKCATWGSSGRPRDGSTAPFVNTRVQGTLATTLGRDPVAVDAVGRNGSWRRRRAPVARRRAVRSGRGSLRRSQPRRGRGVARWSRSSREEDRVAGTPFIRASSDKRVGRSRRTAWRDDEQRCRRASPGKAAPMTSRWLYRSRRRTLGRRTARWTMGTMEMCSNLIGGEWVSASDHATFESREPGPRRRRARGLPERHCRRRGAGRGRGGRGLSTVGGHAGAGAGRDPLPCRRAAHRASRRGRAHADAGGGQDARRGSRRGDRARDILRYFAGEGWRAGGDVLPPDTVTRCSSAAASRSAWWPSSRPGTSPSPSRPGRSRRRSCTATRWCSSRPARRLSRPCGWSSAWWTPVCRPGS